jgi:acetyltransferase-like isoleucine patch superfamily enzyme
MVVYLLKKISFKIAAKLWSVKDLRFFIRDNFQTQTLINKPPFMKNNFFSAKSNASKNDNSKPATFDETTDFYPASIVNRQNDNSKIIVGKYSRVFGHLVVFKTGKIEIGDYSLVNTDSYIISSSNIKIGNRVLISWNVSIFDSNSHPVNAEERHAHFLNPDADVLISSAPTVIEDDVWIGCNSIILKGVTIGKRSIVSAGSVVTKDVQPDSIVAGNPASLVKKIVSHNS